MGLHALCNWRLDRLQEKHGAELANISTLASTISKAVIIEASSPESLYNSSSHAVLAV